MPDRQQGRLLSILSQANSLQEAAIPALETALEKTTGLGARIDLVLAMVRMGLFSADTQLVISNITRASEYVSRFCRWLCTDTQPHRLWG